MYLKIIEYIVAILCSCQLASTQSNPDISSGLTADDDMITLKRIDLSQDSILYSIVSDFISNDIQTDTKDQNSYYTLRLQSLPNGFYVYLKLYRSNTILAEDCIGYDIVDNKTIIIKENDDYKFNYTDTEEKKSFKYEPEFTGLIEPYKENTYVIKGNSYGKHIVAIGWVMYLPDGLKLGPSDNVVAAPKRKHK